MRQTPVRVLFFCAGNSCRSQMAEGWARHLHGSEIEAFSAGLRGSEIDPVAMNIMRAAGVDISSQRSKPLHALREIEFDFVINLSDQEPPLDELRSPPRLLLTAYFEDPPELAARAANEEQALRAYIRVRDEIRAFIERLPLVLGMEETEAPR